MKKILLTAVCFGVMSWGIANAQVADDMPLPPPPPHGDEMLPPPPRDGKHMAEMEKKMSEKLADELGLSQEQQEQAKNIRKAGREKLKPLFEEMKTIREKMDKIRKENMQTFEEILTPEQKAKLKEIKDKHHEKMKKRFKGRHDKKRMMPSPKKD